MDYISPLERFTLFDNKYTTKRPALFLDRDGVVIVEKHYLSDPTLVTLRKGILELIHSCNMNKIPVIIVTNQSGIERGFFSWNDYDKVTERMLELLGKFAHLSAIFVNGHSHGFSVKTWRKPSPEMLFYASNLLNIDLNLSILVGDRISDIEAGLSAGCRYIFHVLSVHGFVDRPLICKKYGSKISGISDQLVTAPSSQIFFIDDVCSFPSNVLKDL